MNNDIQNSDRLEDFQELTDAPYQQDSRELRNMQNMEKVIDYIDEHLLDPELSDDTAAKAAGFSKSYFVRAFKEYFDIPFSRFVTKLRLRQAARDMSSGEVTGWYKAYGFSSIQAFSRAFRREFGISPREFQIGGYEIPSMPDREQVQGIRVAKEYRETTAATVEGYFFKPWQEKQPFILDMCSCQYSNKWQKILKSDQNTLVYYDLSEQDIIGAWWYVPGHGLRYIVGRVTEQYDVAFKNVAKATISDDDDAGYDDLEEND